MSVRKKVNLNFLILIVFIAFTSYGQTNVNVKKFDLIQSNSSLYNIEKIKKMSNSNNAYYFMALGYFLNSNNNIYSKTKELKYLENNLEVIKRILIVDGPNSYEKDGWVMKVNSSNQNSVVNGEEHLISEGYFFRYVGEFLYILKTHELYIDYQASIQKALKYSFDKWVNKSFKEYGDYSLLFHERLHIAANWALVALYLNRFNDDLNNHSYSNFINQFDDQLLNNFKVLESNKVKYYTWNSTYSEKFTNYLKGLKKYNMVIQDVSHGNHVVLYIIKSLELKNKNLEGIKIEFLVNTLKLKILTNDGISDNIDGSSSKSVRNSGWKISDGWLKLIYFDPTLYPKIINSLSKYNSQIKGSFLEGQFNSIYL